MARKRTEFPSSPYLELRGLDRMVLFAASCISNPNPGSLLKKNRQPVAGEDLARRVQRECLERNEDAPQADAFQDCVGRLIEKGYLKSTAKKLIRVTPVGENMIDRPYIPPSLSIDSTPCSLRDAVTKLHELLREIATNKKAYRWDPRVNSHGQVLRKVLIRWAQGIGLSQDDVLRALKVVVQCGCINVIPCTISTFVDFLLGWAPLSDGQCEADRLVQLWESSIPKLSTETNEFPREPTLLRQFLSRLVASTEVPLSERATRYPTIETRDVARAWAKEQGWARFGLLLEDGLSVIEKLLGEDEGIARPSFSTSPPEQLLAFAREQPWHIAKNAEKTIYTTRYPYKGPLADAFFELLDLETIQPTELRYLDESGGLLSSGPVFRINPDFADRFALGSRGDARSDSHENKLQPPANDSASSKIGGSGQPLTDRENELLQFLESKIISAECLAKVMKTGCSADSIRSLVSSIRKKLGKDAIKCVHKRGYYRTDAPPTDLLEPFVTT